MLRILIHVKQKKKKTLKYIANYIELNIVCENQEGSNLIPHATLTVSKDIRINEIERYKSQS